MAALGSKSRQGSHVDSSWIAFINECCTAQHEVSPSSQMSGVSSGGINGRIHSSDTSASFKVAVVAVVAGGADVKTKSNIVRSRDNGMRRASGEVSLR